MEFKKVNNGEYSFKGLDSWTKKEIEGRIVLEIYDTTEDMKWRVQFQNDGGDWETENFFRTLKSAKSWLS